MSKKRLIWDLPLRIFHWLFVLCIAGAWYTSEQEGTMVERHMQIGYVILGLVIFRLIWGFVGTKHALFINFFPTPSRLKDYLAQLKSNQTPQHAGHNPLGSLMVFLMIVLVLLQAASGLFINDDIFSSGPYYGTLPAELEKIAKWIHHNVFDAMIAAIAIHIAAALYYRFIKKNDLITPMFTGKKPVETTQESDAIKHSKLLIALVVAICCTAFMYWLVVVNAPVEEAYFY